MNPMEIKILDRLPKGIEPEVYTENEKVRELLIEEGYGEMSQKFFLSVLADIKENKLAHWIRWEGYYRILDDDHKDLLAVGTLFFNNATYVRAIMARGVPKKLQDATEQGLSEMIQEYLEKLRARSLGRQAN